MNNKKRRIIIIVICATMIVGLAGTYAYFLASLEETVNERLILKAGTMQLVFKDTDELMTNTEATLNFGDTITKEFEIENIGTLPAYAKISWDNLVNTYLEQSLIYTLEYRLKESNDEWKNVITSGENVPRSETASKIEMANHILMEPGQIKVFKLTIKLEDLPNINQTQDLGATLTTKFTLDEGNISSLDKIIANAKSGNEINFNNIATTDETIDGLYMMEDDYGISYFYRGASENNYVKFGKNKDGEDMWWRIIRINGDGSLRIQYDGLRAYSNGEANDDRFALNDIAWNTLYDDAKYAGWMFGGTQGKASTSYEEAVRNETNSDVKTAVDNWYVENIKNTGYEKYISDVLFCNDRSAYSDDLGTTLGNGYGKNTTFYGGYNRLGINKTPTFKCPQKNDMFTMKDFDDNTEVNRGKIEGNKALDYPVGLITSDEIATAGGVWSLKNNKYYLYKSTTRFSWSLSSYRFKNGYVNSFIIFTNGYLGANGIVNGEIEGSVSPVINIAAKYAVKIKGNGTIEDPYQISEI